MEAKEGMSYLFLANLQSKFALRKNGADEQLILQVTDLTASGFPVVIQQALYAIVGAVALQKGGQLANSVVKERILSPLGLRQEAQRF